MYGFVRPRELPAELRANNLSVAEHQLPGTSA
jgi:hypothetical protein